MCCCRSGFALAFQRSSTIACSRWSTSRCSRLLTSSKTYTRISTESTILTKRYFPVLASSPSRLTSRFFRVALKWAVESFPNPIFFLYRLNLSLSQEAFFSTAAGRCCCWWGGARAVVLLKMSSAILSSAALKIPW